MNRMASVISIEGLTASSRSGGHLVDLILQVEEGECVVLQDWGKDQVRTLYRVLDGEVWPENGDVRIADGKKLGFMIEEPMYHDTSNLYDELSWIRDLQGGARNLELPMISDIVKMMGFESLADRTRTLKSYSPGEIIRYGMAAALLQGPAAIVLDGPFDQCHENDSEAVRNALLRIKESGVAILFDCDDEKTVEGLVDRVIRL